MGTCLAETCHLINIVHAVVNGIGKQLQTCLGRLNHAVLQIILEDIVADRADNDTHTQQAGDGNGKYSFLNAAGMGTAVLRSGRVLLHGSTFLCNRYTQTVVYANHNTLFEKRKERPESYLKKMHESIKYYSTKGEKADSK